VKTQRALLVASLLLAGSGLAGCGGEDLSPVPVPPPPFRVEGGFVRDAEGRALILRGMNLSGRHKYTPYFDFHEPPDYARVREAWSMNSVRFLITWAAVEPARGVFDETYLDALEERVAWARDAGLLVVLDMHQDVYGEGFAAGGGDGAPRWTCDEALYQAFTPSASQWFLNYLHPSVSGCYDRFWKSDTLRAHYIEAWRRVAHRLAGYDDVIVGFDPMNEPYWGTYLLTGFESDRLQPFYEELIAAVRAERPRWLAFTEPASSRNLGVPTGLTKLGAANVVYAPHSYDRDAESGMGFDATHRQAVLDNLAALSQEAESLGAALWIGEYGGQAANPGITAYMTAEYDGISAVAGGSAYWSYSKGGGYSVLNDDGSERTELVDTLVRPWPERLAGDPVAWAFDPATKELSVQLRPDASIAAPTVIRVPARVYPNGVTVACGGCVVTAGDGVVELRGVTAKGIALVTITPK
jgi:endoglycosylceramidase